MAMAFEVASADPEVSRRLQILNQRISTVSDPAAYHWTTIVLVVAVGEDLGYRGPVADHEVRVQALIYLRCRVLWAPHLGL